MWGEVLYGAGHQYDTALLPALVRPVRPFCGLWPPEAPSATRPGRKRPRQERQPGRYPEAGAHYGGVAAAGLVGAGSYGSCPPPPPPGLPGTAVTTGTLMQGVLPVKTDIRFWPLGCKMSLLLGQV
ncbi:hypothetical protein ZHAS_00021678 [Anopheles sinensis]|uniref:Uncharacterized protein n=1 Tax=Anopheles sinensis TaxID=74873 RepID=A0A084WT22_ANOSI|nr:hypothetical protein ZHAS_00021678 [Anopheles sinensis]